MRGTNTMDREYGNTVRGASHLRRAAEEIRRNPRLLHIWAQKTAHRVFAGVLDHGEAWDSLWLAAVAAGLDHGEAQRDIGMGFSAARMIAMTEGGGR
jgi:hypothetical protein